MSILRISAFKGPVQRFSQQVVMSKCFLVNLEEILAQIRAVVFREKRINHLTPTHSNSERWRHHAEGYANNHQRSVSATICKQNCSKI